MAFSLCHSFFLTPAAGIREFTEAEVERATNGYRELIGTGGFGSVYKGKLQYADVAVKVLNPVSEFLKWCYAHV